MSDPYVNIDGYENEVTTWTIPAYGETYRDIGRDYGFHQSFTRVHLEVPDAITGMGTVITTYWSTLPLMKTKFATSRTFRAKVAYREESLEVYLDGVRTEPEVAGTRTFIMPAGLSDGYLWVRYIPSDIDAIAGNTVLDLEENNLIARYETPAIGDDLIIRARKAINAIETFLSIAPTPWIGGPLNNIRADAESIIPGITHIFVEHVAELQAALTELYSVADGRAPVTITPPSFTSVAKEDLMMIDCIEEVLEAINIVESIIIEYLT